MDTVKLFCPNCCDIYGPPSSRFQGIDGKLSVLNTWIKSDVRIGAYFGTTFGHLFFHTYRELAPAPFWKSSGGPSSPGRSPRPGASNASDAPTFVNPNPHGGQKRPAGRIYTPRIYGFRVSERARSGPRMQWLRLRPETAEELDLVDWRGRWLDDEEDDDEYEDPDEEDGEMEDFDPVGA
jgi:casein kinase II subunit beta